MRRSLRRALGWALVGALCVMALTAVVAVLTDDFDETDARVAEEGYPQLLAVLLIGFLLTTALPPILRRLQADARPPRPAPDPFGTTAPAADRLAATVLESVARIEAATDDPEVLAECARLRRAAGPTSRPPPTR